jgi:hypothetical protein
LTAIVDEGHQTGRTAHLEFSLFEGLQMKRALILRNDSVETLRSRQQEILEQEQKTQTEHEHEVAHGDSQVLPQ